MIIMIKKKKVLRLLSLLIALGITGFGALQLSSFVSDKDYLNTIADGNWGLSFQNEGSAPVANASWDYLAKFNAFYIDAEAAGLSTAGAQAADPGSKAAAVPGAQTTSPGSALPATEKPIYLTFDAGFENGNTAPILDALKKHNAPAAFFLVGNFIEKNPDLVKLIVDEGHIVGNHTYSHPDMSAISDADSFKSEISKLENAYTTVTDKELPKFYRPPQGKYSESNLQMAKDLGYTTVFWSLAYVDWYQDKQPTEEAALKSLTSRIHPGAILLLHSTSSTNAKILDKLLTEYEKMGYTFHPLTDIKQNSN